MYGVPQSSILGPPLFSLVLLFFFWCKSWLRSLLFFFVAARRRSQPQTRRVLRPALRVVGRRPDAAVPLPTLLLHGRLCAALAHQGGESGRKVAENFLDNYWPVKYVFGGERHPPMETRNSIIRPEGWRRANAICRTGRQAVERGMDVFWGGFSVGNFPWKFTTLKMTFWEAYIGIFSLLSVCRLSFLSLDLSIHPSQAILQFHVWFWNFPVYPFEFPPSAINSFS